PAGGELTLVGVSDARYESVYGIELANGRFPQPNEIILPMATALQHSLNVGDVITLENGGEPVELTVSGRLKLEEETGVFTTPPAYVPLSAAQQLNQTPDAVDQIGIVLTEFALFDEAKSRIAAALPADFIVSQANGSRTIDFNILIIQGGMAIVGLIILLAAAFVIMNAFAMAVTARTEEIGALRAVGMVRRQIMWLVLGEGFILGVIGTTFGLIVGLILGYAILNGMNLLDTVAFAVPWWALLVSIVLGLGVTVAASWLPARRASRVPPIVAARGTPKTAVSDWYTTHAGKIGLILLILILTAVFAIALILRPAIWEGMAVYGVATIGMLAAMFLLLPRMIGGLGTAVFPLLIRRFGAAGRLAADNFKRNPHRTATTATALTAGLTAVIFTTGFMQIFLKGGFAAPVSTFQGDAFLGLSFDQLTGSDSISINDLNFDILSTPLDPDLLAQTEHIAQANGATMLVLAGTGAPSELAAIPGNPILFVDPAIFLDTGNYTFFTGNQNDALHYFETSNAVLLQPMLAERLDVDIGETVTIPSPSGDLTVTVAGIGGSGFPFTIMSIGDGQQFFNIAGPSMVGFVLPDDIDPEDFWAEIESLIVSYPEYDLMVIQDAIDRTLVAMNQFQSLLIALLLLAVIIAGLGVVNTMMINVSERQRELGLLRAVGATQSQVRAIIVAEAGTLGAVAAIVAAVFAILLVGLLVLLLSFGGYESM
ncbi:MAG: FtsX-like permease family protein, partial [Anaerolineales bacterium]|nr:FtsX-like permease family protein [Anaerolineales bacterium]